VKRFTAPAPGERQIEAAEDDKMTARTRLTALALASVVVACGVGAGGGGRGALAGAPQPALGTLDRDPLHGAFWRPAGSAATRPALRLARASWLPPEAPSRHLPGGTLASVQAVVRLAASD
jgi:hypothetical protein